MNDLQRSVWTKLQDFLIDEGTPAITFEQRLAQENGWSVFFARRVVEEYKRFLYLALFGGHPVCPSDEVDQCWHAHMTFTRSYWDRLCKDVLGVPLHHDPSGGGRDEDAKHDDMYAKTKLAYALVFNEQAPSDIWPPSFERFRPSMRHRAHRCLACVHHPEACGPRGSGCARVLDRSGDDRGLLGRLRRGRRGRVAGDGLRGCGDHSAVLRRDRTRALWGAAHVPPNGLTGRLWRRRWRELDAVALQLGFQRRHIRPRRLFSPSRPRTTRRPPLALIGRERRAWIA